jgi:hypothetical protein
MTVALEQSDAEGVNGAEESAIERGQNFHRDAGLQNVGASALLHLVGGAIGERHDHELRQPIARLFALRNLDDAIGDRACFSGTGRRHNREIFAQLRNKAFAIRLIDRLVHDRSSSSSVNAGCVNTHFSSKNSLSIGRVASG